MAEQTLMPARRRLSGAAYWIMLKRVVVIAGGINVAWVLLYALLATMLREGLRGCDVLARWGGEEFLALLPACDRRGAYEVAERLRQAVAAMHIEVELSDIEIHGLLRRDLSRADAGDAQPGRGLAPPSSRHHLLLEEEHALGWNVESLDNERPAIPS